MPMERLSPARSQDLASNTAGVMLRTGRAQDRAGRLDEAAAAYQQAAQLADGGAEQPVLVEALRRLAVIHFRRNNPEEARQLCRRSLREAILLGEEALAGEALNALAGFEAECGELNAARALYVNGLALAGTSAALRGRIEQNLGILASIQGDQDDAIKHYRSSLAAFEQASDEGGAAIAYHNLGLVSSRRGQLEDADRSFNQSAALSNRTGDIYLAGICELSRAEVANLRQQYSAALRRAEAALEIFEQLGTRSAQSSAHRIIGMILRESGRTALAEERLRKAIALAQETGSPLYEAEAARELARLHQEAGQKQEAADYFTSAHRLFRKLDAKLEVDEVSRRMVELAAV